MHPDIRYDIGCVDPTELAQRRAEVAAYSDQTRVLVELLATFAPPPSLALLVYDIAGQAWSDGLDYGVARGTVELEAIIAHFPGLRPALQVVADHVGAITAPCTRGESCSLFPDQS